MVAKPTIDALMRAYLVEDPHRRRTRRDGGIPASLDLFRAALEGYGYQYLNRAESAQWDADQDDDIDADDDAALEDPPAGELGPPGPFCRMLGVRPMLAYLDEFFDDFMIRKVAFGADAVAIVIDDVRGFLAWLGEHGHVSVARARSALARAARAADEVPAADRLSSLLYKEGQRVDETVGRTGPDMEVIEDFLVVDRVAPGRIWLIGVDGPLKVPEAASRIARPGWTINLVIGRVDGVWRVLEVGNAYPRTIA